MHLSDLSLESLLDAAIETTGSVVIALRPDHTIMFWNRAAEELFGVPREQALGQDYVQTFLLAEDRAGVTADIQKVLAGEPTHGYEDDAMRVDGSRRSLVWNVRRLVGVSGAVVGIVAAGFDITARRDAERTFRLVWNESTEGLLIGGGPGIVDCNPAALAMLGLTDRDQLVGHHPREFSPEFQPDGRRSSERAAELDRLTRERGEHRFTWTHQKLDGTPVPTDVHVRLASLNGRRVTVIAWRDLTEAYATAARENELREHLVRAQRLDALGHLVGGIAHDFNNLLSAIRGSLDLAAMDSTPGSAVADEIALAQDTTTRAATLVQQLLAIGRQGESTRVTFDWVAAVRERERLLRRLLPSHCTLVLELPAVPLFVWADAAQLEQVLVNLVVNARDATSRTSGPIRVVVQPVAAADGARVRTEVIDAGTGMAPEVSARVFDPFFTTKAVGEGSGLGLAVVYGIVSSHGGTVRVESALGRGTTISVDLPAATTPAVATDAPVDETGGWGSHAAQGETVLLVEDEPSVRSAIARLLQRAGYEVLEATHGAEALTVWHAHASRVHAVVSDVRMPVMTGPELVRQLRLSGSRIPVVLMSGFADAEVLQSLGDAANAVSAVLNKPFEASVLRRAVASAIDEGRASR